MDKRSKKTQRNIKDALALLIEKNQYNNISVTDLCKKAKINRGTFYLHYHSVTGLIKKLESDIIDRITTILKSNYKDCKFDYKGAMTEVIDYIKEEQVFLKALFSKNGDISFILTIENELLNLFKQVQNVDEEYKYLNDSIAIFMISGAIGVFNKWIKNDCQDNIYELIVPFGMGYYNLYRAYNKKAN